MVAGDINAGEIFLKMFAIFATVSCQRLLGSSRSLACQGGGKDPAGEAQLCGPGTPETVARGDARGARGAREGRARGDARGRAGARGGARGGAGYRHRMIVDSLSSESVSY